MIFFFLRTIILIFVSFSFCIGLSLFWSLDPCSLKILDACLWLNFKKVMIVSRNTIKIHSLRKKTENHAQNRNTTLNNIFKFLLHVTTKLKEISRTQLMHHHLLPKTFTSKCDSQHLDLWKWGNLFLFHSIQPFQSFPSFSVTVLTRVLH